MRKVILLNPWCTTVRNPRTLRMEVLRTSLEGISTVQVLCCRTGTAKGNGSGVKSELSQISKLKKRIWAHSKDILKKIAFPDPYVLDSLGLLFKLRTCKDSGKVCVISFSPAFSTHLAAWIFRRFHPNSYWIADVGDLYFGNPVSGLFPVFHPLQRRLQKFLLNGADHLVFNSKAIRNKFIIESNLDQEICSLIYNGSSVDFSGLAADKHSEINFFYAGSTYAGLRDGVWEMNILSDLIGILQSKGHPSKMTLAGNQCDQLVRNYSGNEQIQIMSPLDKDELIQLYRRTDFLVNFSNGSYPGLPSKLSEYRASGLPIVCFATTQEEAAVSYLVDYAPCFIFLAGSSAVDELAEFILNHRGRGIQANNTENQRIRSQWIELVSGIEKV